MLLKLYLKCGEVVHGVEPQKIAVGAPNKYVLFGLLVVPVTN